VKQDPADSESKLDFTDIKDAVSSNYLAVQEITKDTFKGID